MDEMNATIVSVAKQKLSRLAENLLGGATNAAQFAEVVRNLAEQPDVGKKFALLIRDYCADLMRPEVQRFAGLMEMKLAKHDPVRGMSWKKNPGDPLLIISHAHDLLNELASAINRKHGVGIKAADVANHMMILADMFGDLDPA